MAFYLDTYPEQVLEPYYEALRKGDNRPPKIVFLPEKNVMRTMILANLKFAANNTTNDFLRLFGFDKDYIF